MRQSDEYDFSYFFESESEKLLTAFTEEKNGRLRFRYGWGAVLILETGFHVGEALALEWGDIDEEKRTLKVTKNMVPDGKNIARRTEKTKSDKRRSLSTAGRWKQSDTWKPANRRLPLRVCHPDRAPKLPKSAGDDGDGL